MNKLIFTITVLLSIQLLSFAQTSRRHSAECNLYLIKGDKIKHVRLAGIENDSLKYVKDSMERKIFMESLSKITFKSNKFPLEIIGGAVLFGIAGYLLGSQVGAFPGDFFSHSSTPKTYAVEGMVAGIFFGALIGSIIGQSHDEEVYTLANIKNQQKKYLLNKIISEHLDN